MFEGSLDIADDVYRLGYITFCFYQPLLFEGSIALKRKLECDFGASTKKLKKRHVKASKITFKDGKPIARTIDGPDSELKPTNAELSHANNRTLIRNYFKVAKRAKVKASEDKQLKRDCQDLWLLLSKVGFVLYEKNQRFEKVNISIPIKVIYALLSFENSELRKDLQERTRFVENLKASLAGATLSNN